MSCLHAPKCFLMHPSIFYNRFLHDRGICLCAFVCVWGIVVVFMEIDAQWGEGSFASLK